MGAFAPLGIVLQIGDHQMAVQRGSMVHAINLGNFVPNYPSLAPSGKRGGVKDPAAGWAAGSGRVPSSGTGSLREGTIAAAADAPPRSLGCRWGVSASRPTVPPLGGSRPALFTALLTTEK